jgi:hypothetical protein
VSSVLSVFVFAHPAFVQFVVLFLNTDSTNLHFKFAQECGEAARQVRYLSRNFNNWRQFLTFVVLRKNRSVEEVNQKFHQP